MYNELPMNTQHKRILFRLKRKATENRRPARNDIAACDFLGPPWLTVVFSCVRAEPSGARRNRGAQLIVLAVLACRLQRPGTVNALRPPCPSCGFARPPYPRRDRCNRIPLEMTVAVAGFSPVPPAIRPQLRALVSPEMAPMGALPLRAVRCVKCHRRLRGSRLHWNNGAAGPKPPCFTLLDSLDRAARCQRRLRSGTRRMFTCSYGRHGSDERFRGAGRGTVGALGSISSPGLTKRFCSKRYC